MDHLPTTTLHVLVGSGTMIVFLRDGCLASGIRSLRLERRFCSKAKPAVCVDSSSCESTSDQIHSFVPMHRVVCLYVGLSGIETGCWPHYKHLTNNECEPSQQHPGLSTHGVRYLCGQCWGSLQSDVAYLTCTSIPIHSAGTLCVPATSAGPYFGLPNVI